MIKLYKKIESNIGRGVVVFEYGRPCKRRIKAVAKGFTDFVGTRDLVDVSRGRFDDGRENVHMFDAHTLDTVWDNWHAFMKDEVARLEAEIKEYLPGHTKYYEEMLAHWRKLLERADEAQERRRRRREQKREADAHA